MTPREVAVGEPAAAAGDQTASGKAARPAGQPLVLLTLAGYLVAALFVTWRLWADPASNAVAGNPDDADLFAWYMRYAATAVAHGDLPALVTTALNAPAGINLMWNSSSILLGVLLAPVTLLSGSQVSLTVLTTAGFAGSAAAMFLVLRRWGVRTLPAALGGAVYGFSPALLQSAIGHYDLQFAVLPPLMVDAVLRLVVTKDGDQESETAASLKPWFWRGVRLGVLTGAELFISEELTLTTALACLLIVAFLAVQYPRAAVRQAALTAYGLMVALAATLVVAGWALWVQFAGPLTQSGSPFLRDFYVNDLTGFVTPSSYLFFHTSASAAAAAAYQGQPPEYLAYLGWPLIIVAVLVTALLWRQPVVRALAAATLVLAVLSLGGHPLVSGATHQGTTLPWHWIESLPLAGSVLPDRLSILADGTVAALLAFGLGRVTSRLSEASRPALAVCAAVVAVLACLPLVPRPLPAAPVASLPAGWTAAFRALRLAPGATVLVVPVPDVHLTAAMRWVADSGQQISLVGGYFIGPAWNGLAYIDGNGTAPTASYLNELWAAGLRPGSALAEAAAGAGLHPPAEPLAEPQAEADLTAWNPAAVVAVTQKGSALAGYLDSLLGRPSVTAGGVLAWRR
jgi:hypothetical protein